jgi:pantothenate kinase type III
MRLIADCGNSSVKLAVAHDGGIWLQERLPAEPAALDDFLRRHAGVDELVVLPAATATTAAVARWWAGAGSGRPLRRVGREVAVPDVGQYPTLGLDRIAAGLAAVAQEQCALVVVDCGTATTFSAWRPRQAGDALFLGGLILPGARACLAGLAARAPALPPVDPAPRDSAGLQHDTPAAIAAAVGIGYPAMVAACLERVRRDAGIAEAIVTGGAAAPLLGDPLPRRAYRPTLVVEGVEMLARR